MQKIFDLIVHLGVAPAKLAILLLPVACIIASAFINPEGAVNTFMIKMIDVMFVYWPSMPDDKKVGYLLTQFALAHPAIGWGPIYEILEGVGGLLLLFAFVKLFKMLPFI